MSYDPDVQFSLLFDLGPADSGASPSLSGGGMPLGAIEAALMSPGVYAGIVVGVLVFVAVAALGIVLIHRHRMAKQKSEFSAIQRRLNSSLPVQQSSVTSSPPESPRSASWVAAKTDKTRLTNTP